MAKKSNRFRLRHMSNEKLAKFIFSDEFDFIQRKFGYGSRGFYEWMNQKYDDSYPYSITDITIEDGDIYIIVSGFKSGDINIGDVLEISPIDGERYRLIITKVLNPMYTDESVRAKTKFEDIDIIPLDILSDMLYRNCKLLDNDKIDVKVYNV